MDDNVKDDFENITSSPKPSVQEKEKNPARVKGGLAAQASKRAKTESNKTNLYIGIGIGLVILILLKKTSSTSPPSVTPSSESQVVASEKFDDDMFNL